MRENKEELLKLLNGFYPPEQAEAMLGQITETEAMLKTYPAPQPDRELLHAIMDRAQRAHRKPRPVRRWAVSAAFTAAACLFIAVGILLQDDPPENPTASADSTWSRLTQTDQDVVAIASELDSINSQLQTIHDSDLQSITLWQIEIEELESTELSDDTSFWKG